MFLDLKLKHSCAMLHGLLDFTLHISCVLAQRLVIDIWLPKIEQARIY